MPYFTGPNIADSMPNKRQRHEQDRQRMEEESGAGDRHRAELDELQPSRDDRLVVAVGQLAAERRQEETTGR